MDGKVAVLREKLWKELGLLKESCVLERGELSEDREQGWALEREKYGKDGRVLEERKYSSMLEGREDD